MHLKMGWTWGFLSPQLYLCETQSLILASYSLICVNISAKAHYTVLCHYWESFKGCNQYSQTSRADKWSNNTLSIPFKLCPGPHLRKKNTSGAKYYSHHIGSVSYNICKMLMRGLDSEERLENVSFPHHHYHLYYSLVYLCLFNT